MRLAWSKPFISVNTMLLSSRDTRKLATLHTQPINRYSFAKSISIIYSIPYIRQHAISMDDPNKNALEADNSLETSDADTAKNAAEAAKEDLAIKHETIGTKIRGLLSHLNIYLLLFILVILLALIIAFLAMRSNNQQTAKDAIKSSQDLTQETIDQLKDTQSVLGDPKQTLNIESNAIFSGKVLVRDSLDVAGTIKVGGSLSLPGITVSGTSSFDSVQINNLQISGDTAIQGTLSVQKGITVSGSATFSGPISAPQVTTDNLELNNDLKINRHIDTGGPAPGITPGSSIGGGGTVSINGTDTAGTVTINTGGSTGGGILANMTFSRPFNETPHCVVSPIGYGAAALDYYLTRTVNGFTIATTNAPPGGTSFSFDYVCID